MVKWWAIFNVCVCRWENFSHNLWPADYLCCLFLGPTSSGKSTLLREIISNADKIFVPPPAEIIICYSIYQPLYNSYDASVPIKFIEGLATMESLPKDRQHRLLVIDDLMEEVSSSKDIADFYTKFSHHYNYSIITLTQNLFCKGPFFRTISLNSHHFWLMKSVRDISVIKTIGRQMGKEKLVIEAY